MSVAIVISITISLSIVGVFYIVMCTDSKNNAFLNTMMSTLNRIPGGRRAASAAVNAYVRSNVVANRSSFHSNSSSYLSSSNLHQSSQTHKHTHTQEYMFFKRNPILQIVYLALLGGGYAIAVSEIFPLVPNIYLASWHKITFSLVFAATLISFYFACNTDPGYITKENISRYNKYPYDFKMFTPKRCRTTGILKPARSKFCSIMQKNVARYDHYCGWLAQPVGEENYRYFLLFLSMTCSMLFYATVGIALTAFSIIETNGLRKATFLNRSTYLSRDFTHCVSQITLISLNHTHNHKRINTRTPHARKQVRARHLRPQT